MRRIGRHVVIHHLAFAELVEIGFRVLVFDQLVDRDDVERAVPEGETGGHVQALEDGLDLFLSAIVGDGVDVAETERADEQRTLVAPRHLPRGQHARCIDFDLEARRQLDLLHQGGEFGFRCAGRRTGRRREALLGFGLVAEEPVVRRMGPEFLVAGLVVLERLLLRADLSGPGDNANCRERKDGSIENRFHRITPYAARRLRMLFILEGSRDVPSLSGSDGEMSSTSAVGEKRAPQRLVRLKQIGKKSRWIDVHFDDISCSRFAPHCAAACGSFARACSNNKKPAEGRALR